MRKPPFGGHPRAAVFTLSRVAGPAPAVEVATLGVEEAGLACSLAGVAETPSRGA